MTCAGGESPVQSDLVLPGIWHLGGAGGRCFTLSHIIYIFLGMMAAEKPEKQDDLNLFSWKDHFAGKTYALPHKWARRLTEQEELGLDHSLPAGQAQEHCLSEQGPWLQLILPFSRGPRLSFLPFGDLPFHWSMCNLNPFGWNRWERKKRMRRRSMALSRERWEQRIEESLCKR